jgi:hypothetical protein
MVEIWQNVRVIASRLLVVTAIALYLAASSCVLLRGEPPAEVVVEEPPPEPARRISTEPYRAIGMQFQRVDWLEKYKQSVDEIADVGADAVKIVVDARQEDASSNRVYLDQRTTPTLAQLRELFRHAKSRGLRIIFMPIVLLDDPKTTSEWRGTLAPDDWEAWFDSYRAMLGHYAWVAEGEGVDVMVVGSELISSQTHEDEWRKTIAHVRESFTGELTYSSNWDRYTAVPFWDALDLIGMNSYWTLGDDAATPVEEIVDNWQTIQKDLLPWLREQDKPLLLTEVGWTSMDNAAREPWDYTTGDPIDLELQARLYRGFFHAWQDVPELGGYSIWEWPPGDGGPTDRGYTPEGKPAEQVLREQWAGD